MAKEQPASRTTAPAGDDAQWDDVPTHSRFEKWDAEGQYQQGELVSIEESKKYPGKGFIAQMISSESGELIAFSCPVILERTIRQQKLIGKSVRITFTGEDDDVKLFRVQVAKTRAD